MTGILISILYSNQVCQNEHQKAMKKTFQNHQMTCDSHFLQRKITFQQKDVFVLSFKEN
jgi:hypothetical protein